jgi:hypothetical protein
MSTTTTTTNVTRVLPKKQVKRKAKQPAQVTVTTTPRRKIVQKVVRPNGTVGLVAHVPECVHHYLEASINPFDSPEGACLPADLFPLPSYKRVIFARGSFATGTTGYGFISMSPVFVSDVNAVNFTSSTSVGGNSTAFTSFTVLGSAFFLNAPFNTAAFTGGPVNARSVAYGIRIRCTASMMNRGGSYVAYEQVAHQDLAVTGTFTSLKSTQGAQTSGIPTLVDPNQWDVAVCSSGPVIYTELNYSGAASGPLNGLQPLAIAIQSAVPAMTFDYEVFHHVEYNGVVTTKTPSHASPAGFSKAVEAMKGHTTAIGPVSPEVGPSILERFAEGIRSEMPRLMEIGAGIGNMLLGNEAGGLAMLADGSMNIISDIVRPAPQKMLTDTQRSILAPSAPVLMNHH